MDTTLELLVTGSDIELQHLCHDLKTRVQWLFTCTTPENILHASKWFLNKESDELVIANSQASRMMNDFHNRGSAFLIYPGKNISDDGHFSNILNDFNFVINLENITIRKLIICFGGNDIYLASRKLNLSNEPLLNDISIKIIEGNENADCNNIDVCDTLNLFDMNESTLFFPLVSCIDKFFEKLVDLTEFFPSDQVLCDPRTEIFEECR